MSSHPDSYLVDRLADHLADGDKPLDLARIATDGEPLYRSTKDYDRQLAERLDELAGLQDVFAAENRHAVLVIFQAMDAAGKDGMIKHVMSGVNPQGCQVIRFQPPTSLELAHDFLWRAVVALPPRGNIGIFNRSYYEEVLVLRVHPEILRGETLGAIPEKFDADHTQKLFQQRYRSIVDFERHIEANGTRIVKIFLHLSRDEQARRLIERIDNPDKNWKFSEADLTERRFWNQYQTAYAEAIAATHRDCAPWYIVPADDKKNARLIVSDIVIKTLRNLDSHYPVVSDDHARHLKDLRRQLEE